MSFTTIGTTTVTRPANDSTIRAGFTNTAERRVRALAPTVFCPEKNVDQCLAQQGVRHDQ